jgi:uncharacterized protein YoxC
MEELFVKTIPALGSAGILAAALWYIARVFIDATLAQIGETTKQMSARIDSLEKHIEICDRERKELFEKLFQLQIRHSVE